MRILGVESTCDETGAAIVEDGKRLISSVVASSLKLQKEFGGVVPEIAAREQVKVIIPVLKKSLQKINPNSIDAIAVATGPGLVGSLLVGVETAKALAFAWNKPLIGVNHLLGHVYANWLESDKKQEIRNKRRPEFPLVALIVSGGHTDLLYMQNHKMHSWLGGTLDDAAGEVFDKVARVMGLGYPGGPEIERVAQNFKSQISNVKFPKPMMGSGDFNFSFSGLKTAVANYVKSADFTRDKIPEVAWLFQESIVDVLVKKTMAAAKIHNAKSIVVGGGVAANSQLRSVMEDEGSDKNFDVYFPDKKLSIDNGAMIAAAAWWQQDIAEPLTLQAEPSLYFSNQ